MAELENSYPSVFSQTSLSTASIATIAVASGATGKIVQLYKLILVAAGTTTITFKDGSTALSGAISLTAGVPLVLNFDGNPWYSSSVGNALNIANSASVQISGTAYYTQAFPTTQ